MFMVCVAIGVKLTLSLRETFSTFVIDYGFTADMESRLDAIVEGTYQWSDIVAQFYDPFMKDVAHAKENMEKINREGNDHRMFRSISFKNLGKKFL